MTFVAQQTKRAEVDGTLGGAIRKATQQLAERGIASPRYDAEMLAAHLLRVERGELWRHLDQPVPIGFVDLVQRRCERIPLQHLTGVAHFRTVSLCVGPGVFIPRPETEVVVDSALGLLHEKAQPSPVVVDLCAGSGAIAVAIATERPDAVVHAVEVDPGAAPWLGQNGASAGVHVHRDDAKSCLPELNESVDLVISNPPYIPLAAIPRDQEVARYDPVGALYSGDDGLDHIRIVEQTAHRLLKPGGWVVVEHADLQGQSAPEVFTGAERWAHVQDHVDLNGRDRFLTAQAVTQVEASAGLG